MSSHKKPEIIISALGTKGDIHPMLGVAKELCNRGYVVHFLSNDFFEESVISTGVNFVSVGTLDQHDGAYGNEKLWTGDRDAMRNAMANYYLPTIKPSFNFITRLYEKNSNLLVIGLSYLSGAKIATDYLKIPFILFSLSPYSIPTAIPPYVEKSDYFFINYLRVKLSRFIWFFLDMKLSQEPHIKHINKFILKNGLKPIKRILRQDFTHNFLTIGLYPTWFGMPAIDWPKNIKLVGFPLFDTVNMESRKAIDLFITDHGCPLVFTMGTGIQECKEVFEIGSSVCKALKIPGIFTGGKNGKTYLHDAENCIHVDYVDFEYTLPKCKAIIHHGGIGTISQAIKAGIPQIIRPVVNDQPDNAIRIQTLGLGVCINPKEFTFTRLVDVIKSLPLSNAQIQSYSSDVCRSYALKKSCDLIEEKLRD